MSLFKNLFGQNKKKAETERPYSSNDLFAGVKKGKKYLVEPYIKDKFKKENWGDDNEKRGQIVLLLTAAILDKKPVTFELFDMNNEATIVCNLNKKLISKMANGFSCDIAVKTFTDHGYPLLRFIIFWDFPNGDTHEMEQILNIEWTDIQEFFNTTVQTKEMYIHGITQESDGSSTSKFVIKLISSEERNQAIVNELNNAIESYDSRFEGDFDSLIKQFQ